MGERRAGGPGEVAPQLTGWESLRARDQMYWRLLCISVAEQTGSLKTDESQVKWEAVTSLGKIG